MALNIREKQRDAIVRLLHFNAAPSFGGKAGEDVYKVLVLDDETKDIVAPLLRVADLRKHGVTLHLLLRQTREPIPDAPAVYLVSPTSGNVEAICRDLERGLYESSHVAFSSRVSREALERLAAGAVASGRPRAVRQVLDANVRFQALEPDVFSLGIRDAHVRLNDPRADERAVEEAAAEIVERLLCALGTLGVTPVIRCPRGGAAELVAARLDARLRDAAKGSAGGGGAGAGALGAARHHAHHARRHQPRPLLLLFDRGAELAIALRHPWTYRPLVADVLGMRLNRIDLPAADAATRLSAPSEGAAQAKRSYEVDDSDFFWRAHATQPFPKIAEEVEGELARYKAAVARLGAATRGASGEAAGDAAALHAAAEAAAEADGGLSSSTRVLASAVGSLPELTARKRVLDKHTNLATALLGHIKRRGLDRLHAAEEDAVAGAGKAGQADSVLKLFASIPEPEPEVLEAADLDRPAAGDPASPPPARAPPTTAQADAARAALVWLLAARPCPPEAEISRVEGALRARGALTPAFAYARRVRRLEAAALAGGAAQASGVSSDVASLSVSDAAGQLSQLLGSTFNTGLSQLTRGVKSLLGSETRSAIALALEALQDPRPRPETEGYAIFDPLAPPGQAARGPPPPTHGAIVFVVGGGSYLEAESLQGVGAGTATATAAAAAAAAGSGAPQSAPSRAQPSSGRVLYGATEILTGEEFLAQLDELATRAGLS